MSISHKTSQSSLAGASSSIGRSRFASLPVGRGDVKKNSLSFQRYVVGRRSEDRVLVKVIRTLSSQLTPYCYQKVPVAHYVDAFNANIKFSQFTNLNGDRYVRLNEPGDHIKLAKRSFLSTNQVEDVENVGRHSDLYRCLETHERASASQRIFNPNNTDRKLNISYSRNYNYNIAEVVFAPSDKLLKLLIDSIYARSKRELKTEDDPIEISDYISDSDLPLATEALGSISGWSATDGPELEARAQQLFTESVVGLIVNYGRKMHRMAGSSRFQLIDKDGQISIDFYDDLRLSLPLVPDFVTEFFKLLASELRDFAYSNNYSGDWGSLCVSHNAVYICAPSNNID